MFIAVDIGKSKTRIACSKDLKEFIKVERFPTFPSIVDQRNMIKDISDKISMGESVQGVIVGVPGIVDHVNGRFYKINTYPELNGLPYSAFTQDLFRGESVFVENDALIAAFGEATRGSGKEFDVVAYLTLSTGVGGARIAFKHLDPTFYYMEPGHQIIVQNGRKCDFCGQNGCLQSYVSGPAFEEIYKMKPDDCNDESIWNDYSVHLSSGIINIISMWSPEVIILGGGMSQKFDFIYSGLSEVFTKHTFFPIPEIRKSSFGDDSGLQGGFSLLQKINEK